MRTSFHTHSVFCDGSDTIETLCRVAVEKGLAAIGFSSHAPLTRKTGLVTGWHCPDERLGEYCAEIAAARKRWQGSVETYAGLEVDYIKGMIAPADADLQALKAAGSLDYLIGSVHFVITPAGVPRAVDGSREDFERLVTHDFSGDSCAVLEAYWQAVGEMIDLGGFDIAGHLDVIKKNNQNEQWFSNALILDVFEAHQIAERLKRSGALVEVNTGGINRKRITETYPSAAILRRLAALDVPFIITSDAHCAADLDGNYDTALAALRLVASY